MRTLQAAGSGSFYRARAGKIDVVDVPTLSFLSVDGAGPPGGADFARALAGLYPMAYGVRFALRDKGVDEKVSPLEALWWTADPAGDFWRALARGGFSDVDMAGWSWKALIHVPDACDAEMVNAVRDGARRRHPESLDTLAGVSFGRWREGLCVQTLHVGPYASELPTVEWLHASLAEHGYQATGRHHEIYLGDPRRCAPERLRTILRQPVTRTSRS